MEPITQVQQIEPGLIIADANSRYGLKQTRIDSLSAGITAYGSVHTPLHVETLAEPVGGKPYRVITGHYRHASVTGLNESGAGLPLPCIVHPPLTPAERLALQLSENMERENQSPMDMAVAMQAMLDTGSTKEQVRAAFARPGGRKGNVVQPASNSFVNMTLSFLSLPKAIQTKIHSGLVGVAAAYELTKVSPEKRQAVLEKAESARLEQVNQDDKDEEKFLSTGKKAREAEAKVEADRAALAIAKELAAKAEADLKERQAVAVRAYEATRAAEATKDADAKKKAAAVQKEAEAEVQVVLKAISTSQKQVEKLEKTVESASKHAADRAKALKKAREEAAKKVKVKGATPAQIKKAAAAVDATGHQALNASEMRKTVAALCLAGGHPKVIAIGQAFQQCFSGVGTEKSLYDALVIIVGAPKLITKPAV